MSLFLGIVQGVAEFLPISSSGHLSILQNLLRIGNEEQSHLLFDALLHFGTMISICIVYRQELRDMIRDRRRFLKGGKADTAEEAERFSPSVRTVFLIVVALLPLLIFVPFISSIELLFYRTMFIGFALIITGFILFVSDRTSPGRKNERTVTIRDALMIGAAQALALIPGLSRSGTTISVGIARGLDREFAVRFSLLLSLPAVFGASIISLVSAVKTGIDWSLVPVYLVGLVVAAVTGYFAIRVLNKMSAKGKFGKFAYYCWAVGGLTIFLSIIL
jgi:undecaprenyl-diphosphatase